MKKILVAEDNPTCMEIVTCLLAKGGYEILQATNGVDTVKIADHELPDLILMDVQLPEMSGFEAVDAIRANTRTEDINIVVMTVFSMEGDRERILAAGYDGLYPSRSTPKISLPPWRRS